MLNLRSPRQTVIKQQVENMPGKKRLTLQVISRKPFGEQKALIIRKQYYTYKGKNNYKNWVYDQKDACFNRPKLYPKIGHQEQSQCLKVALAKMKSDEVTIIAARN